ncbi:serine/threonine transporter SstT [Psittacicella gerlachiana]|uniref:Serine/threonine transporter SstT n=1 Tax=Psittacicella gerlachiana TaxID=2028574 RepID=A0A3A1YID6_9GAMM|nr:serine/threonine transporter SstT [Psittacicella gerlachiana]RIY37435.1 serine/threonine transporter SstT [Psittacicella gerlachiana]
MLKPISLLFRGSLILRILIAIVLALVAYYTIPSISKHAAILGQLFITLLRSIAPFLVFILLIAAIIRADSGTNKIIRAIVLTYIAATLISACISAAITLFAPPIHLNLTGVDASHVQLAKESSALEVLETQFLRMFENPVKALVDSNFMALLTWSVFFGIAFRFCKQSVKDVLYEMADATGRVVGWIVQFAPIGVFGIFSDVLVNHGIAELAKYGQLILLLVSIYLVIELIFYPLVGFIFTRKNPYPDLFKCIVVSGIPAFFSRSSAANIPVNLKAADNYGIPRSVSAFIIPLGANISLTAAAATITVLSITLAQSLGIEIHYLSALLACVIAALCALGCSGVPGGSLLMIPIAASLFGVPPHISSQMIAIGFLIGVVQDSVETAVNSSGDIYFTKVVCDHYGISNDPNYENN